MGKSKKLGDMSAESPFRDGAVSARTEEENAFLPLIELEKGEVHKSEIAECLQALYLSPEDKLLEARSCFLVYIDENMRHKLLVGVLMLTEEHLSFYSKKSPATLVLALSAVERVHRNPHEQYANSLSVINRKQQEFLFAGVGNVRLFMRTWSKLILRRSKALRAFLSEQANNIRPSTVEAPVARKFPRLFSRRAANQSTNSTVDGPNHAGKRAHVTRQPLFSLIYQPFSSTGDALTLSTSGSAVVTDTQGSSNVLLWAPPIFQTRIKGNFVVHRSFCFFRAVNQLLVFRATYEQIVQLEVENTSDDDSEVLISLFRLKFPLQIQKVRRSDAERLLHLWEIHKQRSHNHVVLAYHTYDQLYGGLSTQSISLNASIGDGTLQDLKQSHIEARLPPPSDYQLGLWHVYFRCHNKLSFRTDLLRRLVFAGIPNRLRGQIWCTVAGVFEKRSEPHEVSYGCMYQHYHKRKSAATQDIRTDIHRSLPEHPFYQESAGRKSLKNVLCAYSYRNEAIGYCQSMNLVTALILLFMSEESAFVLLGIICEDLLPNYYTPSMEGSLTDQQILRSLLKEYLPEVDEKCKEIDAPIAVLTLPWFLCLFIHCLPMECTLRVLDVFFACGRATLFWVALAIFALNENDILQCTESTEVIFTMKSNLENLCAEELIETTFRFSTITEEKIDTLWREHYPNVLREIKESSGLSPSAVERKDSLNMLNDSLDQRAQHAIDLYDSTTESAVKRFPQQARFSAPSFRLHQSNVELKSALNRTRNRPEVSHTTASLIHLIREGFTGQVLEQDAEDSTM